MSIMLKFRNSPNFEAPADANRDNRYMVTIKATDGTYMDTRDVMVMVTNLDEPGRVTFWRDGADATTAAIVVGDELGGAVDDSDGNPGDTFPIAMYTRIDAANVTSWQWAKKSMMMDSWMDIGTDGMYTVMDDDAGHYLRATATYTDAVGTDMAKVDSMPTMMVGAEAVDTLLGTYDANNSGEIEKSEVIQAIKDYFAGVQNPTPDALSKDDVVDVIKLYFASLRSDGS